MIDPEGLPERGGTAGALVGLAEGFVRDWVTNGVILLSLIVVVAGLVSMALPWVVLGPLVGLVGAAVGFASIAKRWPITRTWLVLVGVLVADIVLLVATLR
jgi:hypothetical protein